ncbi:MAG: MAPEG family protein [Moraxellaceae bacterium]
MPGTIMHSPILAPIVALVAWSLVMWTWMYATRLPAMFKAKMKSDPYAPRGEQMNQLPAEVRWKADNYNHLMEQPTIFYAIALTLALMDAGSGVNLMLAWAYVGLRVVHSLVQAIINKIELRFVIFVLSSLALIGLTFNAASVLL